MKDLVIDTLGLPGATKFTFSIGAIKVGPGTFGPVIQAIKDGKITVEFSNKLPANIAVYSYKHNRYRLGFQAVSGNADKEAVIVHESVHAALDILATPVTVKLSESAAYIAQCLYYYYSNQSAFQGGQKPSFANKTLAAAWTVAMGALTTPDVTDSAAAPLYAALAADPLYQGRLNKTDAFDGV
ncbi:MAG: hypothetical protein GC186_14605 [Rhodobacteraceae bacterium]|nr:hypothetical protein [Paracoccaceae bacterium]